MPAAAARTVQRTTKNSYDDYDVFFKKCYDVFKLSICYIKALSPSWLKHLAHQYFQTIIKHSIMSFIPILYHN